MPRRGLDRAQVVDAAVQVADAEGLEAVTVARVALELGVRGPSIYNHVDGRAGLVGGIALRGMHELAAALSAAATGRSGRDAIVALADAYRRYANEHPGRYAATVRAPADDDEALRRAAAEILEVVVAALRACNLEGDASVHAVRAVRSALHGFVALEGGGGFAIDVDRDRSFAFLVDLLAEGLIGEER